VILPVPPQKRVVLLLTVLLKAQKMQRVAPMEGMKDAGAGAADEAGEAVKDAAH